ncbi:MAG: helix-turn-helix domain-containing protein [Pseudobdellovibrionaceae bacterium]|jgi:DNA-binding response OmpR family regulator|nr:helix-turn-helix domain-containing protein [Pseudobdellovibrionaceae bacterium]
MKDKIILRCTIENARLKALVEEQLATIPEVAMEADASAEGHEVNEKTYQQELSLPVRLGVLKDKVRYNLSGRDRYVEEEYTYDLGTFWLLADRNLLQDKENGEEVRLTDKERLFLRTLFEASGHQESRENLLKIVWGYADGIETHTLETHLYRLRQKLEVFNAQDLIQADRQGNYRLNLYKE